MQRTLDNEREQNKTDYYASMVDVKVAELLQLRSDYQKLESNYEALSSRHSELLEKKNELEIKVQVQKQLRKINSYRE